jgi:hypothetical protein
LANSFLITFKPASENKERGWPLEELQKLVKRLGAGKRVQVDWRFGNRKDVALGDRVFLLLQGKRGPAIIGYGNVAGMPAKTGGRWRVRIRFEALVDPSKQILVAKTQLVGINDGERFWRTLSSGIRLSASVSLDLERLTVDTKATSQNDRLIGPNWRRSDVTELKDTADTLFHNTFQQWRERHPNGIFLNVQTKTQASLHSTRCQHLGDTQWDADDHSLTRKLKVLGDSLESLQMWATQHAVTILGCQDCLRDKLIDESLLGDYLSRDQPDEDQDPGARADAQVFSRTDINSTEKQTLVNARRGQGLFRERVIRLEGRCRVTGVDLRNHLRASHIKPWKDSSDAEKLDGNNGLLLAPHLDHLFDKGYISFSNVGAIIISRRCAAGVLAAWNVSRKLKVAAFRPAQRPFLTYHRAHVLKQ